MQDKTRFQTFLETAFEKISGVFGLLIRPGIWWLSFIILPVLIWLGPKLGIHIQIRLRWFFAANGILLVLWSYAYSRAVRYYGLYHATEDKLRISYDGLGSFRKMIEIGSKSSFGVFLKNYQSFSKPKFIHSDYYTSFERVITNTFEEKLASKFFIQMNDKDDPSPENPVSVCMANFYFLKEILNIKNPPEFVHLFFKTNHKQITDFFTRTAKDMTDYQWKWTERLQLFTVYQLMLEASRVGHYFFPHEVYTELKELVNSVQEKIETLILAHANEISSQIKKEKESGTTIFPLYKELKSLRDNNLISDAAKEQLGRLLEETLQYRDIRMENVEALTVALK